MIWLPAVAGVCVAIAVAIFGRATGLDRDRAFYPVVMVVVASYYDLFAIMAGGGPLLAELISSLLFVMAAAIGFRTTLWVVVAGLALHGMFDLIHGALIDNSGVPVWWPSWCLAYDVAAAIGLAVLIMTRKISAREVRSA